MKAGDDQPQKPQPRGGFGPEARAEGKKEERGEGHHHHVPMPFSVRRRAIEV